MKCKNTCCTKNENMLHLIDIFCIIFSLIFNGCRALDNIALNKTFRMRSVFGGFEGKENRAVDGNRSQNIHHCTHTNPENKNSTYVYVDIGYIANIYNVSIYYREYYEDRLHGYALYYSEKLYINMFNELDLERWNLCYKDDPVSDKPNGIVSQVCKGTARYVSVYQNNTWDPNMSHILEICEIEIFGCNPRQFIKGGECIPCPVTFCEVCGTDGVCLECTNQKYGYKCEKNCSVSCVGGCNISTGQCYECTNRKYGYQCEKNCSETCVGGCNISTGQCYECTNQKYGYQCEKNCSETCVGGCNISSGHCNACSPNKFGIFCNETCGQCREEPDKDSCDDGTGTCVNGCERGFTGKLCDEECNGTSFGYNCSETCSETCKLTADGTRLCNSSIGHCLNCVAGKRGVYCKEGCNAKTYGENCSRRCGHCLNGSGCNSVSGACAEGCDAGYQGIHCNETCHNKTFGSKCGEICGHCRKDTACDPFSGSCKSGCEPGYQELTCKKTCGLCRHNTDCDQFNGTCSNGCQEGYQGEICNETCDINYYGEDCTFTCNEHCACAVPTPVSICHHVTGECLMGCKDGWIGKRCDSACSNGTFGQNCAWKCNEWCSGKSQSCDPRDGSCLNGCIPGFGGSHCNMYCDRGRYGKGCLNFCGYCFFKDCDHITGHCVHSEPLCEDGYRGANCDKVCESCTFGPDCRHNCSDWCYDGICILESKDIKNDSSQKELIKDLLPIIGWYISPIIMFLTLLTAYRLVKCCRRLKNRPSNSALY